MACGGGGKSPVWRQMLADLYGCPVKTVKQSRKVRLLETILLAGVGAVFITVLRRPAAVC